MDPTCDWFAERLSIYMSSYYRCWAFSPTATYACVTTCIYICIHPRLCMHICLHVIYACALTHLNTGMYTWLRIYVHMYLCTSMFLCMHVYNFIQ